MRRSLAVVAVAAVAGIAVAVVLTRGDPRSLPAAVARRGVLPGAPPGGRPAARPAAPPPLTAPQIRATAARWVTALWTRAPGRGPFDWLTTVADITAPDLAAQLRNARPTLDDQLTVSVTVDIDGVYPSAADPGTGTVTCVAHRQMTTGVLDQPCATTLTVRPGPGGAPTVTDVQ